jgi:mono/diheme cytochrome c family protein
MSARQQGALDRYAARCGSFVSIVARIAVLGARSAPRDTGNQPRGSAGRSRGGAPWLVTCALLVSVSAVALAQAVRTVQEGVFTDAQAARGQGLYAQRCTGCHGPALNGAQAPPLVGDAFVGKWRTEPLSGLFIKIRYSMPPPAPPAAPAQLTNEQAVDLVAHVLKSNGFPAGRNELPAADMATSGIGWPAPRPADGARPASAPPATYPPVANLAQLMRGVFFPSANLIFTVQTRDPAVPMPPPPPTAQGVGTSVFEWGMGIYTGWPVVENAAVALADASLLMLAPGLRCENGRLAPITDAEWIRFTDQMIAVAKRTYRLAQTRSQDAVSEATGDLSDACAACHRAYRDVGGRGRGADPTNPNTGGRCTPRQ